MTSLDPHAIAECPYRRGGRAPERGISADGKCPQIVDRTDVERRAAEEIEGASFTFQRPDARERGLGARGRPVASHGVLGPAIVASVELPQIVGQTPALTTKEHE
eukprot:scaffold5659_cov121-Isochrysis_galbana.AAC.8